MLLVADAAAADGPAVTDARIGVHPDRTRFVLELNGTIAPRKVFTLPNPYRVVIDLPELGWHTQQPEDHPGQGVIEGFRFGLFKPGTSRVVLDLNAPVTIREMLALDPRDGTGYRMVVDLQKVSPAVFRREQRSLNGTAVSAPELTPVALRPPIPSPKPTRVPGKHLVVIDPGHGGIDPGAVGAGGVYEKAITLEIARRIEKELEASGRYDVVLTRERDIFLKLRDRLEVGRHLLADLFISIHADTIDNRHVRGASVYTLSNKASDAEAEALARKENKADLLAGVETVDFQQTDRVLTGIFIDLTQKMARKRSIHFAGMLVEEMRRDAKVLSKPRRSAGFAVLKAPEVPSVLVELGYLSNSKDARLLRSAKHHATVAQAIRRAVDRYFAHAISMND
jgi:N-acetylmuramoyl-L-alanine amidase